MRINCDSGAIKLEIRVNEIMDSSDWIEYSGITYTVCPVSGKGSSGIWKPKSSIENHEFVIDIEPLSIWPECLVPSR